eukprot:gb/GEZN01015220.1/.p1 GENE.gb/GEZN01015220.1/~~gb/GEZN01015220.1/.p1  ORF type:complete len:137 (-),score=3.92 gb/GEZN01015220.1/:185-595(-)
MLTTRTESGLNNLCKTIVRTWPQLRGWVDWWKNPLLVGLIIPALRELTNEKIGPDYIRAPSTNNYAESQNRDAARFYGRETLPIVAAAERSYIYISNFKRDYDVVLSGHAVRPRQRRGARRRAALGSRKEFDARPP